MKKIMVFILGSFFLSLASAQTVQTNELLATPGVTGTVAAQATGATAPTAAGTTGATLRVYMEYFEADANNHGLDPQDALKDVIDAAGIITELKKRTGRDAPTVIT